MEINIGLGDLLLVSPMIALFLMSLVPITIKVLRGNREQNPVATLGQGLIGLVAAAVLLFVFAGRGQTAFYSALVFDGVTKWVGVISLLVAGGALLLAYENAATKGKQFSELIFLLMNSALGMLILLSAADLLMVFIGLEIMSLALYLLIAISHEEKLAKEAAFKYFILGSFASAIFLYGVAFVFGTSGTTYLPILAQISGELINTSRLFLLGLSLIVLGFCFKVSIVPFHSWTPDVYQGAPTPLTAFMATAIKAASFAAFLRVIAAHGLFDSPELATVLQWLAVITMTVGNVAAIIQNNLKRMLAYSSVAHSGYLLVGIIAVGMSPQGAFSASGVVFYLAAYSIMTLGSFAIVALFERNENVLVSIDDLGGMYKKAPVMAISLTILLLSLAGIPPTMGFFGKFYVFAAAVQQGLVWLAFWGVINSVVGVYYYLRPIVSMYMHEEGAELSPHARFATQATVALCAILILGLGIFSSPLFEAVEASFL